MISEKIQQAFNDQVNAELFSAYLYLSMHHYFQAEGLPGFANWMYVQTLEEMTHAQKFFDFVNERNGRVILKAIETPQSEWESPLDAFKDALKHEEYITGQINDLLKLSRDENDYAAESFLKWFIDEQVEEEASVQEIIDKLKLMAESGHGLYIIDRELAQRTFVPPAAEGQ